MITTTARDAMDMAASLLNDSVKSIFKYEVMLPYLNMAVDELQEEMELNNVPLSDAASIVLSVAAGVTTLVALPTNLIDILQLLERSSGTTNTFQEVQRVTFLPEILPGSTLNYWSWTNQQVTFLGATEAKDIKLNYTAAFIMKATVPDSVLTVFNSTSFLGYRTAALCANFIGENKTRHDDLNVSAAYAMNRMLERETKDKQSIITRRRPFLAAYKTRGL